MDIDKRHMSFRILDDPTRDRLQGELQGLEDKLQIEGIGNTLFSVVMELVGNAVKANVKRAYFNQKGYNLENKDDYEKGLENFGSDYPNIDKEQYRQALEELDLKVDLDIDLDHNRLLIFVQNNTLLLKDEEKRIRAKLAGAMDVKDVMEFYMHYGDDTEGRGLGLAMTVLLIKDMGFNPDYFRVYHEGDRTIARIEFPLDANYRPIREQTRTS